MHQGKELEIHNIGAVINLSRSNLDYIFDAVIQGMEVRRLAITESLKGTFALHNAAPTLLIMI